VATVIKQREGIDGRDFRFVLPSVAVGTNRYGKPRTSCVAVPPSTGAAAAAEAPGQRPKSILSINAEQQSVLQALRNALDEFGELPPPALKLPKAIRRVVKATIWKDCYLKIAPDAATAKENTINVRMKRASEKLQALRVIGRINPFVWITGRPVKGVIEPTPAYSEPYPGRPEPPPEDIGGLF
jgi:hypothetical protein